MRRNIAIMIAMIRPICDPIKQNESELLILYIHPIIVCNYFYILLFCHVNNLTNFVTRNNIDI